MKKEVLFVGLSDTHLNRNSLEDNISIFSQLIIKVKQLNLKVVYHFGDFFTNRDGQPFSTLITLHKIAQMFEKEQITLICIPGNHDKVFLNSDPSYLDIFRSKYFKVIDHPEVTEGFSKEFELAFLPYYKEVDCYPDKLKQLVDKLDKKKKYVLLTHIAVSGVQNNDGSVVENDLKVDLFKKFYKVFVGHYHNRSQVGDNVFYIGSAFPQNFGEDSEKGFVLFYTDGSHDYFKPKFKEFLKFEVPFEQVDHFVKEPAYKQLIEEGNKVRFVITGEDTAIKSFDKTKVTNLGISVQLKGEVIEANIQEAEKQEFVSFNFDSIVTLYKKFCKESKFKDKLGIEFLNRMKDGNKERVK